MKLSYSTHLFGENPQDRDRWKREPLEKSIERLARYGYDAAEISWELDIENFKEIRKCLDQFGIHASSILPMYTRGLDRDVISSNPQIRRAAIDFVKRGIDMAGELDANIVVLNPSASMKLKPEASPEQEWEWAVEGLREIAEYAAPGNKVIAIEPWQRLETYFINRLGQALKLKQDVGLDNVGVMPDFFHMNIEEVSLEDALRECGRDIVHVHATDSNKATPGKGHLDFNSLLSVLKEIGYDGYLVLLDAAPDPMLYFPDATDKEAINEAYASEAIRFIKSILSDIE